MANGWHEDFEDETFPPEMNEGHDCFDDLFDDDGYPDDEFLDDEFDDEVARVARLVGQVDDEFDHPF